MKRLSVYVSLALFFCLCGFVSAQDTPRHTVSLNGTWQFEQTEKALPPQSFTRQIPVPGLVDLAEPKIEQYERYFNGTQEPRYNWYRKTFRVPGGLNGQYAVLTILKSNFNTQIMLNGYDLGSYMECNTPVECNLTPFLEWEGENELLIRVGERAWLPKQAATGVDREKYTDIPGIWDDVFIAFTGPFRVERVLVLPDVRHNKATVKTIIENHANIITRDLYLATLTADVSVSIREKLTGRIVGEAKPAEVAVACQNRAELSFEIPLTGVHPWTPEDPFLYESVVEISNDGKPSDSAIERFGMRDFKAEGKFFTLNGKQYRLLGSTINLYRFFEDPERAGLPWDREWVKKLLIDIPKSLRWNAFRMCIGLAPDFWYDLADEFGIMIQNEWPMWQVRGWNDEIRKEYTDWIWQDGSHPSIIIWDAMNELKHEFIGNILIPELKKLDPTRIWDAGYMTSEDMVLNDMDEPHYYPLSHGWWMREEAVQRRRDSYRFGGLFQKDEGLAYTRYEGVPLVLNEYGWLWLNRDGTPGIRTKGYFGPKDTPTKRINYEYYDESGKNPYPDRVGNYEYFLGNDATAAQRWEFQAYMMGVQTEAIRSSRDLAGVLSFCYLANNRGYTGDWFVNNIRDLEPAPALKWMYHYFAPFAVFIDLEDGRYLKNPKTYDPGETMHLLLFGINDSDTKKEGSAVLKLVDEQGVVVYSLKCNVSIASFWEERIPVVVTLPEKPGCYMFISELSEKGSSLPPQVSRRYVRIGAGAAGNFPAYEADLPPGWPK